MNNTVYCLWINVSYLYYYLPRWLSNAFGLFSYRKRPFSYSPLTECQWLTGLRPGADPCFYRWNALHAFPRRTTWPAVFPLPHFPHIILVRSVKLWSYKCSPTHRRQLHGGDLRHGQNVVGAMPPSRPTGPLLWHFWKSKMCSKNTNLSLRHITVTKVAQISAWKCTKSVTALPQTS